MKGRSFKWRLAGCIAWFGVGATLATGYFLGRSATGLDGRRLLPYLLIAFFSFMFAAIFFGGRARKAALQEHEETSTHEHADETPAPQMRQSKHESNVTSSRRYDQKLEEYLERLRNEGRE